MPTLWAHSHYWATPSAPAVPYTAGNFTGYPGWQTSVILGSGFGVSQVIWEWLADRNRLTTTQTRATQK